MGKVTVIVYDQLDPALNKVTAYVKGDRGLQGLPGGKGDPGTAGVSFVWKGTWSSGTTYAVNEVVYYSSSSYIAILASTNKTPSTEPTYWSLMVQGGGSSYQHPVGFLLITSDPANPSTYLGYGTWLELEGVFPVAYKSGDSDFGTVLGTGGSKTINIQHTHTTPALTHSGCAVGDHSSLTHSGCAVGDHSSLSHANCAVGDHSSLTHSGAAVGDHDSLTHAGCAVAGHTDHTHTLNRDMCAGGATYNVVTGVQNAILSAHSVTQANAHTISSHSVTQPSAHTISSHSVTQPDAHTISSHSVTQPSAHTISAHSVTQPSQHDAGTTGNGLTTNQSILPPYIVFHMFRRTA